MADKAWHKEAKRRWGKEAAWITGDGQFALLAKCSGLTVTLWRTREEAQERKKFIDANACGIGCTCTRNHEIVDLSIAA